MIPTKNRTPTMQSVLRFGVRSASRAYGVPRLYRDLVRLNRRHIACPDKRFHTENLLKFYLRIGADYDLVVEDDHIAELLKVSYNDITSHPHLGKLITLVE